MKNELLYRQFVDKKAKFKSVTYKAHEIANILFERHKETVKFEKRIKESKQKSNLSSLSYDDFQNAKRGQVFLYSKYKRAISSYDLVFSQVSLAIITAPSKPPTLNFKNLSSDNNEANDLSISFEIYDENNIAKEESITWDADHDHCFQLVMLISNMVRCY